MYKVYIVGADPLVERMFAETGLAEVRVIENPLKEAEQFPNPDLVVFTGGSDVTPWLYGKANVASENNLNRDIREVLWYHRFYNTHKVGICRGGQFLFTMGGGVMDQDILGHGLSHELVFHNWIPPKGIGRSVTSTHHQHMAVPSPQQIVLATAAHDGKNEIILNQSTNSLSFQPHPEYQNDECKELFFWYLKNFFGFDFKVVRNDAEKRAVPWGRHQVPVLLEELQRGVEIANRVDDAMEGDAR